MKQALTAGGLISVWFESVRIAFDEMGVDFEEDRTIPAIKGIHPEYGPVIVEFFVPVQGKTRMEITVQSPQLIAEFKKAVVPAYKRVSELVIQQTKNEIERESQEEMQPAAADAQNEPVDAQPEQVARVDSKDDLFQPYDGDVVREDKTNTEALSDRKQEFPEVKANVQYCKHCKSELPEGTKVCPRCGKKQGGGLLIAAIIVGAVILIGVIGFAVYTFLGKGTSTSQSTGSQTTTSESTQTTQTVDQSQLVTLDQYNQIQIGMTYEQVCAVMGREGTFLEPETQLTDENGEVTTLRTYYWEAQGPEGANVCVTFQNGAVATISQYGLQ